MENPIQGKIREIRGFILLISRRMRQKLRFLLMQVRNPKDRMSEHEVSCFVRALGVAPDQVETFDLITGVPSPAQLERVDMTLLGGSGDHSVVRGTEWLQRALEAMRGLHATKKPTFASCWGFQAMALALGGKVLHDASIAEVGSYELATTAAGQSDPLFGALGESFVAQVGHEDHVVELPEGASLLALSPRAQHAYRFDDAPIYCTQFHPELNTQDLMTRLGAYPRYVKMTTGKSLAEFEAGLVEDPRAEALLPRFVEQVFG
jgi:GMP synthase (glutamine-hydrolysing)